MVSGSHGTGESFHKQNPVNFDIFNTVISSDISHCPQTVLKDK